MLQTHRHMPEACDQMANPRQQVIQVQVIAPTAFIAFIQRRFYYLMKLLLAWVVRPVEGLYGVEKMFCQPKQNY